MWTRTRTTGDSASLGTTWSSAPHLPLGCAVRWTTSARGRGAAVASRRAMSACAKHSAAPPRPGAQGPALARPRGSDRNESPGAPRCLARQPKPCLQHCRSSSRPTALCGGLRATLGFWPGSRLRWGSVGSRWRRSPAGAPGGCSMSSWTRSANGSAWPAPWQGSQSSLSWSPSVAMGRGRCSPSSCLALILTTILFSLLFLGGERIFPR